MDRRAAFARLILITAGRAALDRAAPLYFGIAIGAALIFGGNGMRAADLTVHALASLPLRLSLWGVWLIATTAAARALLATPSTFLLRALPVPRFQLIALPLVLLSLAEGPWVVLWTRGSGLLAGTATLAAALAAHCFIVSGARSAPEAAAAALLALAILWPAPQPVLLFVALAALPVGARQAFLRAPERRTKKARRKVGGPPALALGLAYGVTLARGHRALLERALVLLGLAAAVTWLAARNNDIGGTEARAALALVVLAAPLLLAAAGLAAPVLRAEREARWLLDVGGASGWARAIAVAAAVGAPLAFGGALQGLLVAGALGGGAALGLRLALGAALAALALGSVVTAAARFALRGDSRDGDRMLAVMLALLAAAVLSAWALREVVLCLWTCSALWCTAGAAAAAVPPSRRLLLRREWREGRSRC